MTCTEEFLIEEVRKAKALWKDAIEHGDRKGRWYAEGMRDQAERCLYSYKCNGAMW